MGRNLSRTEGERRHNAGRRRTTPEPPTRGRVSPKVVEESPKTRAPKGGGKTFLSQQVRFHSKVGSGVSWGSVWETHLIRDSGVGVDPPNPARREARLIQDIVASEPWTREPGSEIGPTRKCCNLLNSYLK